jgi:hypothetical protein
LSVIQRVKGSGRRDGKDYTFIRVGHKHDPVKALETVIGEEGRIFGEGERDVVGRSLISEGLDGGGDGVVSEASKWTHRRRNEVEVSA